MLRNGNRSGSLLDDIWEREERDLRQISRLKERAIWWWGFCFVLLAPPVLLNYQALGSNSWLELVKAMPPKVVAWLLLAAAVGVWSVWMGFRILKRYGPLSGGEAEARLEPWKIPAQALSAEEAAAGVDPLSKVVPLKGGQTPERDVALLVVHGIGVQEQYETMDQVVRGLTHGNPDPQSPLRFSLEQNCYLPKPEKGLSEEDCKGKRLVAPAGKLDVYELYWAPLVEGVMDYKAVLSWIGSLITRFPRRLELLITGSRVLPHPAEVRDPQKRLWVERAHRDVRWKIGYTAIYVALVTIILLLLSGAGWALWRVGLGLSMTAQDADKAATTVSTPLLAFQDRNGQTLTVRVEAEIDRLEAARRENLNPGDPPPKPLTVPGALVEWLATDQRHPLMILCGECTPWEKVRMAFIIGGGVGLGDLLTASQNTAREALVRSLAVLVLLFLFIYWVVHSWKAFTQSRSTKFLRIADLHAENARFHRDLLRSAGRALMGAGLYMLALTAFVVLAIHYAPAGAVEQGLLGPTLMIVVAGAAYVTIYVGLRPFLSRILADVPIQSNPSAYSPGAKARQAIRAKSVQLLRLILDQGYRAVVILAHSQGTVVAYEALHDCYREWEHEQAVKAKETVPDPERRPPELPALHRVKAFVTIGAALSKVQEIVQGMEDPGASHWEVNQQLFNTKPRREEGDDYYPCSGKFGFRQCESDYYLCRGYIRWYNYWYLSDLVANPIRDYLPALEMELPWYTLPNLKSLWTHSDYWDSVVFYQALLHGGLGLVYDTKKQVQAAGD